MIHCYWTLEAEMIQHFARRSNTPNTLTSQVRLLCSVDVTYLQARLVAAQAMPGNSFVISGVVGSAFSGVLDAARLLDPASMPAPAAAGVRWVNLLFCCRSCLPYVVGTRE